MIQDAEAQFWKSFNIFWLILGTVIPLSKLNFLNSIVVPVKTQHFEVYMAMNVLKSVLLGVLKALEVIWNLSYATHKRIPSLLCGSAPLYVQLKARFVKCIYKALDYNSVFKSVTKYACNNNPMSVCGRNWSEVVCVNGVVTESVIEIYNEWYWSVDVKEMDIQKCNLVCL